MSDEISEEMPPRPATPGVRAIHGVGPAVARRLQDVGLGSLEQLAVASPDELVRLGAGWPFRPDHDRAQEWIDQARRLLAAQPNGPVPGPRAGRPTRSTLAPRARHTFTLEVQTNDSGDGTAVATRVVDVESQAFDTWSGWNPEGIARFVAARCGLDTGVAAETSAEPVADEAPEPSPPREVKREAVLAFGVVDSPVVVPGGTPLRAVLRVGADDTMTVPEGGAVEWDLAVGGLEGRATERLARHRVRLVPGSPLVTFAEGVVPARHERARLVAVIRILGPGDQPRLARTLTDARLDVAPEGPS